MSLLSNTWLKSRVKKFTVEPCAKGHLFTTATFLQWSFFFFFGQFIHSILFQPLFIGHLAAMATFLCRRRRWGEA